jgi:hypothetical protein
VFSEKDQIQASTKDSLGFNIAFGVVNSDSFKSVSEIEKTGSF